MKIESFKIFTRDDNNSSDLMIIVKSKLIESGFIYNENSPQLIIVIGGDGTMLRAIHEHMDILDQVMLCGLHTGSLGFLTDFDQSEVNMFLESIISQKYRVTQNAMLKVTFLNESHKIYYAFNEFRIENPMHTQVIETFINDELFQTFRGNGLCVSTPSGSTAYNKSLGGALIHPSLKAFQIQSIAPIDNVIYPSVGSPMILSQYHELTFKSQNFENAIIGIDHLVLDVKNIKSINIVLAEKQVTFARYKESNFFRRVHRAFIG